jgi:tartrate-resistant acid phosphatase type 5
MRTIPRERRRRRWPVIILLAVLGAALCSVVGASSSDTTADADANVRTNSHHAESNDQVDDHGLRFLAIGDWGGREWWPYSTLAQVRTAVGMSRVATSTDASFVLALGDNFYSHGQATPRRFAATYERVYHQKSLQVPWYVVAGNHDHLGNVTAQLTDFPERDERWNFPSLFYTVKKTFRTHIVGPDGHRYAKSMVAEFVMIDTVVLAGINPVSDVRHPAYFDPPTLAAADESAKYLRWIDHRLSKSTADYLFVAGHYPVYSACSHGNTQFLVDHLEPLLTKHGVTAYLSGHEHCAFHLEHSDIDYILTGTGDECCYDGSRADELPDDADLRYLLSAERNPTGAVGGFASFATATDGEARMDVKYHDQGGKELYTTSLYPRRNNGRDGGARSRGNDK